MLYAHSFSQVELNLFSQLSRHEEMSQIDCNLIHSKENLREQVIYDTHKTLLYSFQRLEYYKHLDTFTFECDVVDHLVEYALEKGYEKIILITYPGAYFNSSNLFLQHKGIIEQKFVTSGIPCTLLNVHAIGDSSRRVNSFHQLFFDKAVGTYMIPQKSNCFVYSVNINNLTEIIVRANENPILTGKYDVFDSVQELKDFLLSYSAITEVHRSAPVYLYFKSFFGNYPSPTMLELFLLTVVPMYKFRTEKEFHISLEAETLQPITIAAYKADYANQQSEIAMRLLLS